MFTPETSGPPQEAGTLHSHFTDAEAEALRGGGDCPQALSTAGMDAWIRLGPFCEGPLGLIQGLVWIWVMHPKVIF